MEFDRGEPDEGNGFQAAHAELIASSHLRLLRRPLLPDGGDDGDTARRLYHAPFVILAHDAAPDPVFFYANLAAQELFEMSWQEMVRLPSRQSAEPLAREERQRLLARVARQDYIDDYAGVRIASSGRRFRIAGATVWNLIDAGRTVGQAAAFGDWIALA
ncbi:MEKHLA domain-containing protein [Sulfurisoma sediminicola]|uniref:MEKHLA domain-containing protein n=1 Tax=Sulfurisoma sediminicola TaxID=1381557 RepID=A0A497XEA3_9PROT|nr:MEKHLA domain-containing protein [Sulfurisoma sediminicola]RLJ64855.1 MEKHLA domain-containing protein [Sulfurisoma sediminicola]